MKTYEIKLILVLALGVVLLFSCGHTNNANQSGTLITSNPADGQSDPKMEADTTNVHDHVILNKLLRKYVSAEGIVDYKGFINDSLEFNKYLNLLALNPPQKKWTDDQVKAYWINAYNAYTVQLIIRGYPVKSIKDLGGSVYKVNTPWDQKFIHIGDEVYDLNNIEHGILRKDFEEPRVHFAVNCASVSCPRLRNEAYLAEKLDSQLDDQARLFMNYKPKNNITAEKAELSKIFSWFRGDFKKTGTVIDFINKYSDVQISDATEITYLDYDWNLNE